MAALMPLIGQILAWLQAIMGEIQQANLAKNVQAILSHTIDMMFTLADHTNRLAFIEQKVDQVLLDVAAITPPGGASIAEDVWLYRPWPNLQVTGEMLSEVYSQSIWNSVLGMIPYHKTPWLAITGGNWMHDETKSPQDIPNLDKTLMQKGDSLLDWLNRCTDPWFWSLTPDPCGHFYDLPSHDVRGWSFRCTLTEAHFVVERDRQAGPTAPTYVLLAADITGDWDDTGGYREYRVECITIPSWAGYRVGAPPLYDVNSRVHQLGWAMFGSGDAWETWQLLAWSNQVLTTRLTAPTKFHLELRDGVHADVYGAA